MFSVTHILHVFTITFVFTELNQAWTKAFFESHNQSQIRCQAKPDVYSYN